MLQTVSAWQKTSKNTCTYASLFFLKHCEPKSSNDNLSIGIVAFAYFLRENLRRNSCISSTENNVWPVISPNTLKLIKKKTLLCISNYLLSVWKSGQTQTLVFDIIESLIQNNSCRAIYVKSETNQFKTPSLHSWFRWHTILCGNTRYLESSLLRLNTLGGIDRTHFFNSVLFIWEWPQGIHMSNVPFHNQLKHYLILHVS